MPHRIARTAVALVLALSLAACIASTNPAGPESGAVAEPGLIGTWRYTGPQDDAWSFVHVLSLPKNKLQIVALKPQQSDWVVLEGHITATGSHKVISLRLVSASDAVRKQIEKAAPSDRPWSFIAYRLEGKDRLVVAQPFKPIQAALKAGTLSGESSDSLLSIADGSPRIASALSSASDPDLFAQTSVYQRVEPR